MSEKVREPESWKEVVVGFFEETLKNINTKQKCKLYETREKFDALSKIKPCYEKLNANAQSQIGQYIDLSNRIKEINKQLKDLKDQSNSNELPYDDESPLLKEEKKKLEVERKLIKSAIENVDDLAKFKELDDNLLYLRKDAVTTEIPQWLNESCVKPGTIKKATHVLRFTHSSSVAEGFLSSGMTDDLYLTTATLKQPAIDMAHNNGALVSISRFFALEKEGEMIFDLLSKGKNDFLKPFSQNEQQIEKWLQGFRTLINEGEIQTADKAKQLYFPINNVINLDAEGNPDSINYHLLTPLFSSSIAESIYSLQSDLNFGERYKLIKEARKDQLYDPNISMNFSELAVQKFGGAQPQNVSMLNKGRSWKANKKDKTTYGVTYLFKAAPPSAWQSQLKPPINQKTVFGRGFYLPGSTASISYLHEFLLRFERVDLSIKNPERIKWIKNWVGEIVTEFLAYVVGIQKLPAGWSKTKDIKLKPEHQYMLDPFREDAAFQVASKTNDWQTVICNDFGWWLNSRLRKDKKFTPQPEHRHLWANLLEKPLRDHHEMVAVELKRRAGGTV